ncbi:MAG: hypothetical protein K940chlam9_01832 [Chlamydiae bacterium]|nr:hypothetical protein [Chlamydiota bacterium]
MALTVVTYGGGEILRNIFNALAMLLNGQGGGFLRPLLLITISIGSVWAVSKALFSNSAQAFLSQFLIPLIAIVGLLLTPTTSVHIEDILKDRSYKVDHVPFLLGKFAELSSSTGYQITKAIENVMHVPNDVSYNSTGMIFGADSAMDISRYQITDGDLANNLRSFTKQCVLYDIALGRYTLNEIKKASDLWKFFEENTSKVRIFPFYPTGEYLSCKQAIQKMAPLFEKEKGYYGQLDVCRNLPLTYQALTGMQKEREELISQQLMMNVLLDEYGGNSFASERAHLQQRSTYQTLGALASSSLVTLRAVIEALVYAAFIFILPLSVLPGGVKFLSTWAWLVLWIQLWPPFYAILNYIMQSVAHGYADTVFSGLTGAQCGLNLFTSIGIHNLQQDVYALSGYLAASIPFLTYAIIKGGVGSFIHLASSMMTPAHTAASASAAEQITGNYSFGNASFGQTSYQNTSGFHTSLSPNLSTGFFYENKGTHSTLYGPDEQILKQSNSELRTSLFSDDSINQSLQTSKMHAESDLQTTQDTYTEGLSDHSRNLADLSSHIANSENYSNNLSQREAYDLQESARYFQSTAENWGEQYGLSSRKSMEYLAGAGIDFFGCAAKGTNAFGSSRDEALSSAQNLVKSEEFQKNFQKLQDVSSSESYNHLDETGKRLVESTSHSFEQMQTSQHSFQTAQSNLNQLSENTTWAEQNSHLIRHSLNQDFVNWAQERYAHEGGFAKVEELLTKGDTPSQGILVNDFIKHIRTQTPPLSFPDHPSQPTPSFSSEGAHANWQERLSSFKQQFSSPISQKQEALSSQFSQTQETHDKQFAQVTSKIQTSNQKAQEQFQSESSSETSLYTKPLALAKESGVGNLQKLASLLDKMNVPHPKEETVIASNFQIQEEPFWMQKEKTP